MADISKEMASTEEEFLHQQIALLQRSYELAAKPYIDRLVSIRSMRTTSVIVPRDFIITIESLKDNTP